MNRTDVSFDYILMPSDAIVVFIDMFILCIIVITKCHVMPMRKLKENQALLIFLGGSGASPVIAARALFRMGAGGFLLADWSRKELQATPGLKVILHTGAIAPTGACKAAVLKIKAGGLAANLRPIVRRHLGLKIQLLQPEALLIWKNGCGTWKEVRYIGRYSSKWTKNKHLSIVFPLFPVEEIWETDISLGFPKHTSRMDRKWAGVRWPEGLVNLF